MTTFTGHLTDAQAQRLIDGFLHADEAAEAEAHHAACAECQALVLSYRALADALDGLEAPPLPDDFTAGVLQLVDVRERAARRERRLGLGIAAAALAGAAVAVFLALGAWGPGLAAGVEALGSAGRTLRLGIDIATPVVSALRLYIALAAALTALPVLFLLSRLMPAPSAQLA
jgi:anti-sigma factor RsiW